MPWPHDSRADLRNTQRSYGRRIYRSELIATGHSVEAIRDYITADRLGFLSEQGLYRFTGGDHSGCCDACFTGRYPLPVSDDAKARQLVLFEVRNP